jgi:hypothetical protein
MQKLKSHPWNSVIKASSTPDETCDLTSSVVNHYPYSILQDFLSLALAIFDRLALIHRTWPVTRPGHYS